MAPGAAASSTQRAPAFRAGDTEKDWGLRPLGLRDYGGADGDDKGQAPVAASPLRPGSPALSAPALILPCQLTALLGTPPSTHCAAFQHPRGREE